METFQPCFRSIERAIAELGSPEVIWFRGHARHHRLLPALFRFTGAAANEQHVINQYRAHLSDRGISSADRGLSVLIRLHHSYVPTRLLAWTESLHVALFCALMRESAPAVFVLNPHALNTLSKTDGIVKLDANPSRSGEILNWPNEGSLPERPLAIDGRGAEPEAETFLFTLHGTNELPLEEQCPDCVRKVVLTGEEISLAEQVILSAHWKSCNGT